MTPPSLSLSLQVTGVEKAMAYMDSVVFFMRYGDVIEVSCAIHCVTLGHAPVIDLSLSLCVYVCV